MCDITVYRKIIILFMTRPFLTSLSAVRCSLGILTLAQCGGSSSDAEGLAPSTIGSKVLNMQVTGITDAAITLPAIFDMTTGDNGAFIIQTQGENMNMWNGAGHLFLHQNREKHRGAEPVLQQKQRFVLGTQHPHEHHQDSPVNL